MLQRQDVGIAVGEYLGRGQGENAPTDGEAELYMDMDYENQDEDDLADDPAETVPPSEQSPPCSSLMWRRLDWWCTMMPSLTLLSRSSTFPHQ